MFNVYNYENMIEDTDGLDVNAMQNILKQETPLEKEVRDLLRRELEKDRIFLEQACRDMEKMESGQAESVSG